MADTELQHGRPAISEADIEDAVRMVPREEFVLMSDGIESMSTSDLIALITDGEELFNFARGARTYGCPPPSLGYLSGVDRDRYNRGLMAGAIVLASQEIDQRMPTPPFAGPYPLPCRGMGLPWERKAPT